jgi:Fe-S oxidoreductase
VLFHRVANTLNYLDIKTVVVSCGTCYDQLQGYKFEEIFPGSRIIDIHEFLLEKGITLGGPGGPDAAGPGLPLPRPVPQPDEAARAAVDGEGAGRREREKSDRCCGESGTFGITRPDIATQVRFRKARSFAATRWRCARRSPPRRRPNRPRRTSRS